MTAPHARTLIDAEPGATPLQRRERRAISLRAHATREDGSKIDLVVVDLSYDGCGIETVEPLRVGERLALAVHRRGTVSATVRWAAGSKAGLVFAAAEPDAAAEPAREQKPRLHRRVTVHAEVTLRRPGKMSFTVRVFDISQDGCKAECIERPDIHEQAWVKFDGIEALEAKVCWVVGAKVGLRFARPIHPAVFDLLLRRLG